MPIFYVCKMIKVTSGFDFKKTIFSTRRRHHPKNSWNIFQIQITPLFWRPQGPQGCLEKQNCPLSSNLAVWCAKIGPKTQKLQKPVKTTSFFDVFLVISEVFRTFLVLGPILGHQTTKFELSGWFRFSRHPWGSWERQYSGVICIWKIFQLIFGCWRHLAIFFFFFKLKPDVTFIILHV